MANDRVEALKTVNNRIKELKESDEAVKALKVMDIRVKVLKAMDEIVMATQDEIYIEWWRMLGIPDGIKTEEDIVMYCLNEDSNYNSIQDTFTKIMVDINKHKAI